MDHEEVRVLISMAGAGQLLMRSAVSPALGFLIQSAGRPCILVALGWPDRREKEVATALISPASCTARV